MVFGVPGWIYAKVCGILVIFGDFCGIVVVFGDFCAKAGKTSQNASIIKGFLHGIFICFPKISVIPGDFQ